MEILKQAETIDINEFIDFTKPYKFDNGMIVRFNASDLYIKRENKFEHLKSNVFYTDNFSFAPRRFFSYQVIFPKLYLNIPGTKDFVLFTRFSTIPKAILNLFYKESYLYSNSTIALYYPGGVCYLTDKSVYMYFHDNLDTKNNHKYEYEYQDKSNKPWIYLVIGIGCLVAAITIVILSTIWLWFSSHN